MNSKTTEQTANTIARECIAVRLRMLNRVVTNIFDDALRDLGVKVSQMNILVATVKMGLVRPAEICKRLQLDTSTLSRNVERMRASGWIEAVADSEDGRAQPFRATRQGRKLLEQAAPQWEKAQAKAREILGDEGVDVLDKAVDKIRSGEVSV